MENNMQGIRGFKVFDARWICRDKQYTCPGRFEEKGIELELCGRGMHFCLNAADCFRYYKFDPSNHVAEVIAHGVVVYGEDKCCTDNLEIVREIPWDEVLRIVNTGKNCTGFCNTGNYNTGNYNTGDWNTGDWNIGNCNTGNYNTGNRNTGDWNTGNCNTGNYNTGNYNTGDWNTGDWNTGDWNIGDFNKSSFNTGCFMTEEQKIMLFNKPSDWTYNDWFSSDARHLLDQIPRDVVEWIPLEDMTEEEKAAHPTHRTTGGYLKELDESECAQSWWDELPESDRQIIKGLPNFDAGIFEQCTGIKIDD